MATAMRRRSNAYMQLVAVGVVVGLGSLIVARKLRAEDAPAARHPIDDAVVGPKGGVPIHPTGRFRSPFANPTFGEPAQVKVAMLLTNLHGYDIKTGSFEADFYVSLTSDKPMPNVDFVFTNGKDDKRVLADKPTFKLFHYRGTFASQVDLHHFPFDTQELVIELEDDDNGVDTMRLIADQEHTGFDAGFHVTGWEVAYFEARILNHYFPDRFEHDDLYYPRYLFKLGIKRHAMSAIFTVYVPAIVIVLISLSGLWLPRSLVDVRSNAGAPMLAAAVLFHFALMQAVPATGYLTRADKLMLGVYVSLFLNMLSTWLWFVIDEKHADRVFHYGRLIVPPVTAAVMIAACIL